MSTLIRNTTTLECGIDRRVDRAGHGEHGGWSLSQGTAIICCCGERLFELADLKTAALWRNPHPLPGLASPDGICDLPQRRSRRNGKGPSL